MQRSVFTTGILGDDFFCGSEGIIFIAPTGQWRSQLPHDTPSVIVTQFWLMTTACPIWVDDFSSFVIRRIAPVGHTSLHFVHSGRQ